MTGDGGREFLLGTNENNIPPGKGYERERKIKNERTFSTF